MKTALFSCVSVIALMGAAAAADLQRPPPVYKAPEPVAAASWTGFYLGANGGYGWQAAPFNLSQANTTIDIGNGSTGWMAGGQAGYNLELGSYALIGFEVRGDFTAFTGNILNMNAGALQTTVNAQLNWLGSADAKFGFLISPTTALSAIGGLAYGHVNGNWNAVCPVAPVPPAVTPNCPVAQTKVGWDAGFRLEHLFGQHWIAGAEIKYFDLGTVSFTGIGVNPITISNKINGGVGMFDLSYKL